MSHTPGPWIVSGLRPDLILSTKRGVMGGLNLAVLCPISPLSDLEVRKANAQLIAAAPEMLEALLEALDFLSQNGYPNDSQESAILKKVWLEEKVKHAIEKARGEK